MLPSHSYQEITNRQFAYIINQGSLKRIFYKMYLSQDMGALVQHVTSVLYAAKKPLVSEVPFTLVNFCSLFWGFSYGHCPPPPDAVVYPTSTLTFTFALTPKYYSRGECSVSEQIAIKNLEPYSMRYSHYSFLWGEDAYSRNNYFTISVLLTDISKFKLRAILYTNSMGIYNIMSIMTKNFVRNQFNAPFLDNAFFNHTKFWGMGFADLVNRFTLKHLPYNKFVWHKATNLLTRSIDYNVTLFYFLYIHNTLPFEERTSEDLLPVILFGKFESIAFFLRQSIAEYNNDREKENLILVAALYGMFNNGSDYHAKLREIHYSSSLKLIPDDAEDLMRGNITAYSLTKIGEGL